STLRFKVNVQAPDLDTNGIIIGNSLNLNGDTLKDLAGNDSLLVLPNLDTSNVFINVGAVLTITPQTTNDFSVVAIGNTSNLLFDLENTHPTSGASAIVATLGNDYSFTGGAYPGTGGDCSASLSAATTCVIDITFTPTTDSIITLDFDLDFYNGYENEEITQSLTGEGLAIPSAVTLISPGSNLSNIQTPQVQIDGIRNPSTVKVYTDPGCSTLHDTFAATAASITETLSSLSEGVQDLYVIQNYSSVDSLCSASLLTYTVDITNPSAPGSLTLEGGATTSQSETIDWIDSTDINGIDYYLYAIGTTPGGDDVLGFTNIGDVLTYQDTTQTYSLINYYSSIKAMDNAGNTSAISTSAVWTLDTTPPSAPSGLAMSNDFFNGYLPATTTVFSWTNPVTDFDHAEVALGTSSGGNEVKDWTESTNPVDHTFTSVAGISECTTIYPSVRAVDQAGNISTVSTSGGNLKWDNTAPTNPTALVINSTESYPHKSIDISWTASSENCGTVTYEISLSTSAGGNDIQDWFDIGAGLTYQVENGVDGASFTLSSNTDYFINIRAVDSAGNISSGVLSSSAFQIKAPYALLIGTESTAPTSSTNLAQILGHDIEWSYSSFTSGFFNHTPGINEHEVQILKNGDYYLSLNIPVTGTGQRVGILNEVFVNGSLLNTGIASSTYLRNSAAHNSDSNHLALVLDGLMANDVITIKTTRNTTVNGTSITNNEAVLFLEYLDNNRNIFSATSDSATLGTNLNNASPTFFEFNQTLITPTYDHDNSTDPEEIEITETGYYKISFNLPTETTCTTFRNALLVDLVINGTVHEGNTAAQGYTRCANDHDFSTYHFNSVVNLAASDVLKIQAKQDALTQNVSFYTAAKASLTIEKIAQEKIISLSGTTTLAGTNWNTATGGSAIQWDTSIYMDSGKYSHSTTVANHEVTILEDGNYTLIYNDLLSSTVQRPNVQIRVKKNGTTINYGRCSSHYIRSIEGHNDASCTLNIYLENVLTNDVITIEAVREAAAGVVTAQKALFSLIKN
ncbi:hypothetical protein N9N67_11270, partial [Bacteriovoracaceae bacterium]|nr:hypothetical protein [Bacteriovoracaceae bacterium]